jgi:hypothetical protein
LRLVDLAGMDLQVLWCVWVLPDVGTRTYT